MTTRTTKFIIIIFSVAFAAVILSTLTADRLTALSFRTKPGTFTLESRLRLMDYAIKLDPLNAECHFKKFKILQEIRIEKGIKKPHKTELYAIKDAIDLRPLWPKYHLYYGLVLEKMNPRPNIMTQKLILSQLKIATELKPYSDLYREKYLNYLEKYGD